MTNQEIATLISERIGDRPVPFQSVRATALEIYKLLGGTEDDEHFDDIYQILLETLPLAHPSAIIDDNDVSTGTAWSSSKIVSELETKQNILPDNVTELPCLVYEFENTSKGLTEIPADKIDADGNLIINETLTPLTGFSAYGLHRSNVLEDANTIYDGSKWYYNAMDIELLNYSKIVYRVNSTTYSNVYNSVIGLADEITMTPPVSLKRPLSDETKAALVAYMEGLDGKVVCWNGIEGYIVGFNDVSNTPKIYNYTESDVPYQTTGNGIFAGHTLLKKGHYYKIHCVRFNHYQEWPTSTGAQYISGWVITFDEIGDLIKTVEDTAEKVDALLLDDNTDIVEITQAEYDALSTEEKNNGKIYSITDAVIVDMNDYYTKTGADGRFNPKHTVTASSGSYRFPNWNANGQITGYATQAYQASQNINGSSRTIYSTSSSALPTLYAPTTAGTQGYYLVSNGSGAPVWKALEVASDYVISDTDAIAGTYSSDIAAFYTKTISEDIVQGVQIKITDAHIINEGEAEEETVYSDSYYLPSSSRIYSGNVELWLMTTADGVTWENIHYLITGDSITRTVTTGNFGPVNA